MKNQFTKYSPKDEIIHMMISKYTLGENDYEILPKLINNENLIIQVNFICLKDKIVDELKTIFLKYQISVNKILSCDYLKGLNNHNSENIFRLADYSINGLNMSNALKDIRKRINIHETPDDMVNDNNRLFSKGCKAEGVSFKKFELN